MIPHLIYTPDNPNEHASVTVILRGSPYTLSSTSAVYRDALDLINAEADEAELLALFVPYAAVSDRLLRLSENITTDGKSLYYDGDALDEGIARHVVRIIARHGAGAQENYLPVVKFLEKLYQNPSARSREQLYQFLRRFNFTITADGDFIGYKGVRADFTSIHAGPGVVDDVPMTGHLPNLPGSTVEVPRSYVNADASHGCSTGLHVGTYGYANGFAKGGLVTVTVNPRDVVSVPEDANYQKVRTCRYRVLEAVEHEYQHAVMWWGDED